GSPVLRQCLASPNITRLSILSRRQFTLPTGEGFDAQKAQTIVPDSFAEYPSSLTKLLKCADGCVWAQGTSQTQVSKEEYIRITHDYPLAAAKAFSTLSENNQFNFVYVSAALRALPSTPSHSALRVFNVRVGLVEPAPEDRHTKSALTRAGFAVLGSVLRVVMPSQLAPPDVLAKVLIDLVTGDGNPITPGQGIEDDGRLVRCLGVRKLGGL
ncbi:hypothetical protein K438DRAFT_1799515, partial [Mycena galopus ATCC 62051]